CPESQAFCAASVFPVLCLLLPQRHGPPTPVTSSSVSVLCLQAPAVLLVYVQPWATLSAGRFEFLCTMKVRHHRCVRLVSSGHQPRAPLPQPVDGLSATPRHPDAMGPAGSRQVQRDAYHTRRAMDKVLHYVVE